MREEVKEILCEILEEDAVQEEAMLEDFFEWDSLAVLSLMSEILKKFKKKLGSSQILSCATVGELLDLVEEAE